MLTIGNQVPRGFVYKIASRCNIACSYCYMYFRGDNKALDEDKTVSVPTHSLFLKRLKSHILANSLDSFTISLHGGEPLLVGKRKFKSIVQDFVNLGKELNVSVNLKLQTNGLLIDEEWLDILYQYDIHFGISVDGDKETNDKYRKDFSGKGTFDRIMKAFEIVRSYLTLKPDLPFVGAILVINPKVEPTHLFKFLKDELKLTTFNILLPDCDHDTFEKFNDFTIEDVERFLIKFFDCWYPYRNEITVSYFNDTIKSIFGLRVSTEGIGMTPSNTVVISTNGNIESHDVLRINNSKKESQTLDLFNNEIIEIQDDKFFKLSTDLSHLTKKEVKCSTCPIKYICGGGFIAHRHSSSNGYLNHSVYCDALFGFINHVYFKLATDLLTNNSLQFKEKNYAQQQLQEIGGSVVN